jgi:hypothetical protein
MQPRLQLRDDLFVLRAERSLRDLRFVPAFDALQNVQKELDGSPITFGRFVDELLNDGLALADPFPSAFSAMTTGSLSASLSRADRFLDPAGRPRGLPNSPLLNLVW